MASIAALKSTIDSAVTALLKYKSAQSSSAAKLQLLPEDDYIYLNLTLTKIPSNPRTNPFKIALSHPILDPTSHLCLIIDDRPHSPSPPSDQIKKLIKSQNIPISKVIKISKLKSNYKPFEAKRKLCDSYDMFLVDKRVVHLLPKLLGKEFFRKKKLPLGVDLGKKGFKGQVERALGSALLYLRSGTCCVMKVGKVAMEKEEVVENVIDAVSGAVESVVPKKWEGVRSLHLKFSDSMALPIYQAVPDVRLRIEGLKEVRERDEVEKERGSEGVVSWVKGGEIGNKRKRKSKGRIHEVHYMDVGEELGGEVVGDEGNLMEESDEELISVEENVGRKKSKGSKALKEGVLGVLNGEEKKAETEKSGVKGKKKKSDLVGEKKTTSVKVKDGKHKKRVSAK